MNISIQESSDQKSTASQYLRDFQRSESMIQNIKTQAQICSINKQLHLPITINDTDFDNSYVCSVYTALIPYCTEELYKVNNTYLRKIIAQLVRFFDSILKKNHINKIVQINNWMLSTNIHIKESENIHYKYLFKYFTTAFPKHSLMMRSLNNHQNKNLIKCLKKSKCTLIPTRQVYIFDKNLNDFSLKNDYKKDKNLLAKTNYKYVPQEDIKKSDLSRIIELYNFLYIEKHSEHNPQFTIKYIQMILNHPYFYIEGFRNEQGVLDAIGGRFTIEKTTTLPIVGYDTSKSKKLGLYRLVLISTILYAEKQKLVFNASSGASSFKKYRGAIPFIEYAAIYSHHLPRSRKWMWVILRIILDKLFVPIMRKFEL